MVFLTGASGFIGSRFLERAIPRHRFRCLVRPESAHKITPDPCVEIVQGDILSEGAFVKAMQGAETVMHLAALIRTSKPEDIHRVNVEGTRVLVSQAARQGASRFIFVSTENALREDLNDAYAASKREAEAIVRTFKNHLILRPCFVYGRGDHHGLGRLVRFAKKSPVLPIFGGLTCRIQPLYIEDMVEYLLRALERPMRGEYVLAGPDRVSLNDFLEQVCSVRGQKRLRMPVPRAFLRISAAACDRLPRSIGWGTDQFKNIYDSRTYSIEKAVKDFGHAPRGLREGLADWFSASKSLDESPSQ